MQNLLSSFAQSRVIGKAEQKTMNGGGSCYFSCHGPCLIEANGCRSHYAACMDSCTANC